MRVADSAKSSDKWRQPESSAKSAAYPLLGQLITAHSVLWGRQVVNKFTVYLQLHVWLNDLPGLHNEWSGDEVLQRGPVTRHCLCGVWDQKY